MIFSLEAVRDNIRNRDGRRVFYLGDDDRLTWEARDYLQKENIPVLSAQEARPARYRLEKGGYMEEKPEHMTHLNGDVLVEKTHPRICFRGAVDTLEAELLLCIPALPSLKKELEEVLALARSILQKEVLDAPLQEAPLFGLDEKQLRQHSHFPQAYYGQPHFMPSPEDGEAVLRLNRLRCAVRNTERALVAALPDRTDLIRGMNRMSSGIYILMIREKSKGASYETENNSAGKNI